MTEVKVEVYKAVNTIGFEEGYVSAVTEDVYETMNGTRRMVNSISYVDEIGKFAGGRSVVCCEKGDNND